MWKDQTRLRFIERDSARERLIEEARRLGRDDDAEMLGGHLASEREAHRVMRLMALVAVATLLGFGGYVAGFWG